MRGWSSERLWSAGHAAYLVGGAVRDALLGRETHDWDVATDARPETILGLFPEGEYENRFGTVLAHGVEITTFRRDHHYPDHRRPASVTFTDSVVGGPAPARLHGQRDRLGACARARDPRRPASWTRATAARTCDARLLRAVGEPAARFDEDALRLLRAARIAAAVGLTIEPATLAAMRRHADDVRWVSGERVGIELRRMVEAEVPSRAFRIMADTATPAAGLPGAGRPDRHPAGQAAGPGLLRPHARHARRGRGPGPGRRADAAVRAAARHGQARHDGPRATSTATRRWAPCSREALLGRVAYPRREARTIGRIIRGHMFAYTADWTDAAVRRFMRRVGTDIVDDVLRLRRADNVGSGWPPDDGGVDELRARIAAQRAAGVPLAVADLAVDGTDLMAARPARWALAGRAPGAAARFGRRRPATQHAPPAARRCPRVGEQGPLRRNDPAAPTG